MSCLSHLDSCLVDIWLFPLNGCRRFGADIIYDTVYTFDAIDDIVRHASHEIIGEVCPVGCHSVNGFYCAQGDNAFIGSFVTHDAYRVDGQQHGASLPYFVVKSVVAKPLNEDIIHFLQDVYLLRRNVTQYADG